MSDGSYAALLRLAREDKARREAAVRAPLVCWAQVGETPESFAVRSERISERNGGARILAVIPHGFPTPDARRRLELPEKAHRLLHPGRRARYRVGHGGRGGAKSHSFARAAVVRAMTEPTRFGCFREYQNSIRESVHKLLSDTIVTLGLSRFFEVGMSTITSHLDAEFIFDGLHANLNRIRSLEGIDVAWIEEAATVTELSWETLVPTIRTKGSELWINLNPMDEADPTYQRFVAKPPPDALVERLTWRDNPWFPPELDAERRYLERVDPDAYQHVWEGEPRSISDAQILRGKYVIEAFEPAAGWDGPYLGADWGFAQDPTTLVRCWVHQRRLFIEYEAYAIGCDIDKTPELFDRVPGARHSIIRADSARPETISYMQQHGFGHLRGVEKWTGSVEDGIAFLRQFEQIVIHPRCSHTAEEARLYRYKVDRLTNDVLPEPVDAANHCWDAIRYALQPMIKQAEGAGFVGFMKQQIAAAAAAKAAQPAAPAGTTAQTSFSKPTPSMPPTPTDKELARRAEYEARHGFGAGRMLNTRDL